MQSSLAFFVLVNIFQDETDIQIYICFRVFVFIKTWLTLLTMNSASSALSSSNFFAISANDILEYERLIILTPVFMTLCRSLVEVKYSMSASLDL